MFFQISYAGETRDRRRQYQADTFALIEPWPCALDLFDFSRN
jgi:hypothetical protein